jgi:hypothetical protein
MTTTVLSLLTTTAAVAVFGLACDRTSGASAAPAPAAVAPAGPSAETASYKVELKAVGAYKKGQPSTFEVVLKTKEGFHVNEEYPTKFKVAEGPGVTYAQAKLEKAKDAAAFAFQDCPSGKDKCTMKISVKFTPEQAGNVKIGGEISVGVCNAETCLVEKKQLDLAVPVG